MHSLDLKHLFMATDKVRKIQELLYLDNLIKTLLNLYLQCTDNTFNKHWTLELKKQIQEIIQYFSTSCESWL